jgi:hypothetical protein
LADRAPVLGSLGVFTRPGFAVAIGSFIVSRFAFALRCAQQVLSIADRSLVGQAVVDRQRDQADFQSFAGADLLQVSIQYGLNERVVFKPR